MFWQNKAKIDEKQTDLIHKISIMGVTIVKMEAEIQILHQGLKVLRGFVNNKLKLEPDPPEIEPEEPEIAIINAFNDGFDEIRKISKEMK